MATIRVSDQPPRRGRGFARSRTSEGCTPRGSGIRGRFGRRRQRTERGLRTRGLSQSASSSTLRSANRSSGSTQPGSSEEKRAILTMSPPSRRESPSRPAVRARCQTYQPRGPVEVRLPAARHRLLRWPQRVSVPAHHPPPWRLDRLCSFRLRSGLFRAHMPD
jgi:hypothetical protein